jgi:hypothetical protein
MRDSVVVDVENIDAGECVGGQIDLVLLFAAVLEIEDEILIAVEKVQRLLRESAPLAGAAD